MKTQEIRKIIETSYSLKPKNLFVGELIWKFAIRNILRNENILLTGMAGSAKTTMATTIATALNRPCITIPFGSTQDSRTAVIGTTHFDKEKGTYFVESAFIKGIKTENAVIVLDELSRAHPDAWNIIMPVLDGQRYIRLEDSNLQDNIVNVAHGVSFIATANIGAEYTSTRVLDRALLDRFTIVEIPSLSAEDETELIKLNFPDLSNEMASAIANISVATRNEVKTESSKLSTAISTRISLKLAGIVNDGFSLSEGAECTILPFFSDDGGVTSERTFVRQLIQRYDVSTVETADGDTLDFEKTLFSEDMVELAKKLTKV